MPLAYSQAAAYLEQTGIGLGEYLDLLKSAPQLAFSEVDQGSGYAHTVASTWQVAMTRLQTETPQALTLLQACAYLSPEGIPFRFLQKGHCRCSLS